MKKRHFTRLSAFALAAALSVITASTPFSDAFPITASVTVSAADETAEGGTGSENLTEGSVEINETNFPDENFRNWLLEQEYGQDGVLTADEIAAVTEIDVRHKNISSLKGIEYFTNITYLNCCNNNLTSLDVSQNTKIVSLYCDSNQLKSLDVSKNTEIKTLACQQNQLTSINVSTNTKLENFDCYKNQLTSLDVSKNTKLLSFHCNSNNITSLDLTNNLQISNISIKYNPILSLDCGSAKPSAFSADPLYMFMVEDGNELVLADKHINPDKIKSGSITGGTVTNGVIKPNEGSWKVTYDYVYNDAGETITCSVGFGIAVNETNFPDEIFRDYIKSELTDSNGNKVGGDGILTADEIAAVTEINVGYKNISSLKGIEYFTALTLLDCRWNQLTSLDLSKNTALTELYCHRNPLVVLKASSGSMNCYANPLSAFVINDKNEFDITAYGGSADNIISDSITGGKIDGNGIIKPDENSLKVTYKYKYNDKGDTITCSVGFVIAVNETNFPDENFRNYVKTELTDSNGNIVGGNGILTADEIAAVKEINVNYKNISSLKGIEYFTKLKELECYKNKLTKLDVSRNTELTTLVCSNNQLTSLDVSKNTKLTTLTCSANKLTKLDLSNNTELEELYCDTNSLTALDLSSCDKLLRLDFTDNQVSELKLSENLSKLNQLICANNKLTELDLSNIEFVYINNGSSNMETKLKCSNNEITNINLKDDAKISSFHADNNPLLAINGGSSEDFCFADDYSFRVSPLKDFITENKTIILADYGINPDQVSNLSNAEISDDKTKLEITDFPATYDYGFADGKTISCTINYGIPVDKEHFPDDNFRSWILKRDYGTDGVLTAEEIATVTEIDVADEKISDLQGIEYFTALERLNCSTNQLTSLDLSKNTKLYWIDCDENQLTSINLNGCTELTEIYCSSNKLTLLDVSANLKLEALGCGNNELQSLDVSKNPNIKELGCDKNKLESLNISANPNLTGLDCSDNKLKSLDVSKNTELSVLYFASNNVEKIDLSGCTELKELDCRRNQLESLDVSKNTLLQLLYCGANPISSLDVSQNTDLVELNCDENSLTELDVSKNTKLEKLRCYYNKLTSLNVSENAALKTLRCSYNQLTSLDLSKNTELTDLECTNNKIYSLDVNNSLKLNNLYIDANPIVALRCGSVNTSVLVSSPLDMFGITDADTFDITKYGGSADNIVKDSIKGGTLEKGIIVPNSDKVTYDYVYNDDGKTITCTIAFGIVIDKVNFPDENFRNWLLEQEYGQDGILTAEEIAEVKEISVSYKSISDLTGIEYFTALTDLYCYRNQLKSLDVSKNVNLTKLNCQGCFLTSLDVSNNTKLTELDCSDNALTKLDVSKNVNLTKLDCFSNNLTLLDVSNNTNLTELDCSANRLTKLDVSKNTLLTTLNCSYNPLTSLDISATAVTDLSAITGSEGRAYKTVFDGGKLDLTTLEGFDVSKADSWDNATIEGNIISIIDPTEPVAYFYDTGREKFTRFMIVAESVSLTADMIEVEDQTYTGEKIEPKPVVKCGNYTLVEGTDYTLSYDKNTDAGTGKVIVTAKGDFYTGSAEAEFKINKAAPAEIILPTASGLTYGQELSESILSDENWKWVDGKVIPTVNNDGYEASIIVDDKNYDYSDVEGYNKEDHTVTRTIEVTVKKAAPAEIILPTASGLTYGQKLSESVLSDENWKWVDGKVIPTVNNDGYEASIIVDDKNYDYSDVEGYNEKDHTVARTIEVTVKKAVPAEIILPTASGLTYGQKLSESVLSDENWKWVDGKVIPTVNNDGYKAAIDVDDKNYDYSDVEGYNEKDHTVTRTIEVTVEKAAPTVNPVIDDADYEDGDDLPEIRLSENDTLGKVEWIEKIAKLVEGKNILDWKFTPEDENYNDVTGTLIVNAKATTTTTTTVTTTTTKPTTSTTKATTVSTTKATTAGTTKPTTTVSTTKVTTASTTKPTTTVSTTKTTTASTTKPTTTVSTTKATTASTTQLTTAVSTTKATTASTTQPTTTVSTTKATTTSATKPTTTVSTTKATTASATKPTTTVSTTKATTASTTKPTTAVSTTKATTASITQPTTVSTTKATTASATKPTTTVSTTKATTASTTKPTTAVSTTKATVASTTKATTVSTTKATTTSATKPTTVVSTTKATTASATKPTTTVSTTKATTASATKPTTTVSTTKVTTVSTTGTTTVSTTKATTASATKPTTAVSTTKATTASTTGTTVVTSTSISTSVSTTATSTTSTPTTTTVPPTTTPQVTEIVGDANGDGKLDVRDAAHIARMLAQRNADKLPAKADFNGDGKIDVRDAAAIARFLAKKH